MSIITPIRAVVVSAVIVAASFGGMAYGRIGTSIYNNQIDDYINTARITEPAPEAVKERLSELEARLDTADDIFFGGIVGVSLGFIGLGFSAMIVGEASERRRYALEPTTQP